jgi:hypothetical protein
MIIKITVFWDIVMYSLIAANVLEEPTAFMFREQFDPLFHLNTLHSEVGSSMFFQNINARLHRSAPYVTAT